MPISYFAAYDENLAPMGLFRVVLDDEQQTADTEYLTAEGTWKTDPSVIDELHEPGVKPVTASDVPDIVDALTGAKGAEKVASHTPDPEAATQPVPGAEPDQAAPSAA